MKFIDKISKVSKGILGIVVFGGVVNAVDLVGNTYATTLNISVADTVSVDVLAVRQGGSFAKSANSAITAYTDNATGYTLTIEGTDNTRQLNNGNNHLSSISQATSEMILSRRLQRGSNITGNGGIYQIP